MTRPALAPLRLRPFRRLLGAYSASALGDWVGEIALSLLVLHTTGSVLAVTAVWVLGRFVPALLAPPVIGRVGREPLRRALPALYAAEAALFAALAVAAAAGGALALVLALAFVDGILAVVARTLTKAAVVAETRPAGLLQEGNALLGTAFMTSFAVGPLAGGVAVATVGVPAALALDAASFAFAAAALGLGSGLRTHAAETTRAGFRHGLGHLRACPRLRTLVAADAAGAVFLALIIPVELVFITQTLGGSEADFGLVLAAWGIGAVLGSTVSVAAARLGTVPTLVAAVVLMVVSYLGMGSAAAIEPVIAFSLLGGIGNGLEGVLLTTLVQKRTPARLQIPVNGALECLHTAAPGLGFLIGGSLAAATSPRAAYAAAGLGALAVLVAAAASLTRDNAKILVTTTEI